MSSPCLQVCGLFRTSSYVASVRASLSRLCISLYQASVRVSVRLLVCSLVLPRASVVLDVSSFVVHAAICSISCILVVSSILRFRSSSKSCVRRALSSFMRYRLFVSVSVCCTSVSACPSGVGRMPVFLCTDCWIVSIKGFSFGPYQ